MVEKGEKVYPPPPITTPRLAPWDHVEALCQKLDRLIKILEAWPVPPTPPAPPTPPEPGVPPAPPEITVSTIWQAKATEELFNQALRLAGTYNTEMVDFRKGKRLVLKVTNTLDQPVTVQPIGNIVQGVVGATDINGPFPPCAAFSNMSIGLAWDDWTLWVGCTLTIALPNPTVGSLKVEAVVQE